MGVEPGSLAVEFLAHRALLPLVITIGGTGTLNAESAQLPEHSPVPVCPTQPSTAPSA